MQPHLQTVKLLAVGLEVEIGDLIPIENPNEELPFQDTLLDNYFHQFDSFKNVFITN